MARGYCEVTININNRDNESFIIDGPIGNEEPIEKEILLTNAVTKKNYPILIKVKNKGFKPFRDDFWPPRKSPLTEQGIYFRIEKSEIHFPKAATQYRDVNNWWLSMKTAYTLLNPDFHRFTFTGKPFRIKDQRKMSKERYRCFCHSKNMVERYHCISILYFLVGRCRWYPAALLFPTGWLYFPGQIE